MKEGVRENKEGNFKTINIKLNNLSEDKLSKPEKVIVIKNSRKAYILFYVLVVVLIFLLISTKVKGILVNPVIFWGIIIFCILIIKFTELHRLREKYEVNDIAVIHSIGLLNVKSKRVNYIAITEVIVKQTLFQRLLGIGDINVLVFSDERSHSAMRNIDSPKRIADIIEYRMMKAKKRKD